jgi:hypothetical protein
MGGDLPKDENLDWLLVCACHPTKAHQLVLTRRASNLWLSEENM